MARQKRTPGVIFYDYWFLAFNFLPDADVGAIIKAIGEHIEGRPVNLPEHLRKSTEEIFAKIDEDRKAYTDKCEQMRLNRIKREQTLTNDNKREQTLSNDVQMPTNNKDKDKDKDNNTLTGINKESTKERANKSPVARFVPPTLEELKKFITDNSLNVDAEGFFDYYTGNGWKVGKNSMKDWKATARNWHRRTQELHKEKLASRAEIIQQAKEADELNERLQPKKDESWADDFLKTFGGLENAAN